MSIRPCQTRCGPRSLPTTSDTLETVNAICLQYFSSPASPSPRQRKSTNVLPPFPSTGFTVAIPGKSPLNTEPRLPSNARQGSPPTSPGAPPPPLPSQQSSIPAPSASGSMAPTPKSTTDQLSSAPRALATTPPLPLSTGQSLQPTRNRGM